MGLNRTLPASYRFDRFTLDLVRGALLVSDGAELPLRPKSFALLQLLVENAGRLLDRDTIMQAIWPDVFVTDDSITQCVRDIRRVLGEEAHGLLRTVPRRGYLFTAEVSRASYAAAGLEELSRLSAAHPAPHALAFASLSDEQGPARRDDTPEDLVDQPHPDSPPGSAPRSPIQRSLLENAVDRASFRQPPVSEQAEPIGLSPSPGAERRQVTILYCDLVGSNALFRTAGCGGPLPRPSHLSQTLRGSDRPRRRSRRKLHGRRGGSPTSAIPRPTRTPPSGRCVPDSPLSRR